MPLVGPEAEQQTLTECRYRYVTETLKDLHSARARFRDLRLFVDFYCFPNKETRKLLHLSGTLPVCYQGSAYNVPVCVWLHQTHPLSPPRCVVCPSVAMAINPSCPHVDPSGTVSVDGLRTWTPGVSNLPLLLSEVRLAFQKDPPLYATSVAQAPPPVSSSPSCQSPAHGPAHPAEASQWGQTRPSYAEELRGIDFGAPPPFRSSAPPGSPAEPVLTETRPPPGSPAEPVLTETRPPPGSPPTEPLSRMMGALRLDGGSGDQSPAADLRKVSAHLSPDRAAVFMALTAMTGRSFSLDDVIEAVQHNPDLPSALKFLTHTCPICGDQVSFSKIVTMTHCSCFLCQSCFTSCFSVAIKERAVHQLTCPQCGQPEIRGQGALEESMDYFNLLDTQIRHFLPADVHELFQRKLRDRALQDMPRFCWCAHCSFGVLHESDRLRMDCPSCRKSTCSQCRSPWSPHHQGRSCAEFQQQTQQDRDDSMWVYKTIECPSCQSVFSLSKGGCLHFTCSQCRHQFCGGCSQRFALGPACSFSARCASRGLHAHHPRDCLYHLRDWSVARLTRLLQHYRATPSWKEPSSGSSAQCGQTAACLVPELRDDGGVTKEEPCGRPAPYAGFCQTHYKERLVEQINRRGADPAVLFSPAEATAELQRWAVAVPTRKPEEPEPLFAQRLRLVLTNCLPLRKQRSTSSVTSAEAPPTPSSSQPIR